MERRRVLILGAAGRDFHNFNVVYRDDPRYEVVGFTATQIPKIEGRHYPPSPGRAASTPTASPSTPRTSSSGSSRELAVDEVVFAYSDVSYEHVGPCRARERSPPAPTSGSSARARR